MLKQSANNKLFIGYGAGVSRAIETEKLYEEECGIVDLRFVKPLDEESLEKLALKYKKWYVFSDSQAQGGVGSALLEFINKKCLDVNLVSFEYEDQFIQHGDTKVIEKSLNLLPEQLVKEIW